MFDSLTTDVFNYGLLQTFLKGAKDPWVGLLLIVGSVLIALGQFKKQQSFAIRLKPLEQTTLPYLTNPLKKSLSDILRWCRLSQAREHISEFVGVELTLRQGKRPVGDSLLVANSYHERLARMGWQLFFLLLVVTAISHFFCGLSTFYPTTLGWFWLGYELFRTAKWDRQNNLDRLTPDPMSHAVARLLLASILCQVLILLAGLAGQAEFLIDFVSIGFYGAYAGMLRVMRSRSYTEAVVCDDCHCTMEPVSKDEVAASLSKTQQMEVEIESKVFERWRCPDCHYGSREKALSTHLVSCILDKHEFYPCEKCSALAVEITGKIVQQATAERTGTKTITTQCRCCKNKQERSTLIARRVSYQSSMRH